MRFKTFLVETAVGKKPVYTHLQVEEAISTLNEHCKDALWMLEKNAPIYRGDPNVNLKTGFAVVDPSKTVRKSTNTTNYYTEIFDNNPKMAEYPKRSRSFIASTNFNYAKSYANSGGWAINGYHVDAYPNVLIPFDGVKIGCVGESDLHNHNVKLFGDMRDIAGWNIYFKHYLKIEPAWASFVEFQKKLDAGDKLALKRFYACFDTRPDPSKFLEEIQKKYSPAHLHFALRTTKTFPRKSKDEEVWVGGPCVLIKYDMWQAMRAALNKGKK